MNSLPILMYHSIDESNSVISISPEEFESHLQFLQSNGYQSVKLSEAPDALHQGGRKVVLTFDDGFRNFFETAFPLLQKYRFQATVFLVSEYCGKRNDWPGQGKDAPILPLLTWEMARELATAGIELGAHSCSHPKFHHLSQACLRREIRECRDIIEQKTGAAVLTFAYPYGIVTARAKELVSESFRCAVGTRLALASAEDDLYCLNRIDVYYLRSRFSILASPLLPRYLQTRNVFRSIRNRIFAG